ncbi:MAG: amidohydrolase [Deltaproteobacteria bacterium]|nr:amidohydrolase [Deltaproteobacteria bacterium]
MAELLRKLDPGFVSRLRALREDLHRHAELGFAEHETAERIRRWLEPLAPDALDCGVAGTGVVALLRGKPGPVVAFRAEMDALPIQESTGLAFASIHEGVMHACGHDGHMAIALGAAELLAACRREFAGSVKLIFQPSEEKLGGAERMIEAGVLRDPDVDAIYTLHARPQLGTGRIALDPMPSAYADGVDILITGRAAHGAYPHTGVDAVVIGSHIICQLQQIRSREIAPSEPVVVSFGSFQAGRARNVIADRAVLGGTVRTRQPAVRQQVLAALERIAVSTARGLGGQARVELIDSYPRVCNDPALLALARRVGGELLGADRVGETAELTMGGDDFGFYLEEAGGVPGCTIRLGVETDQALHTGGFDFGHQALEPGVLLVYNVLRSFLERAPGT